MPNTAQSDLLMSFIGKDGSSIETVLENKLFDLGTKILYLERAISQDYRNFNRSLNKLETDIEFVRELKLINDLCFNNKMVVYDEVKNALDHCFAALGPVDPNDFKKTIQEIINTIIKDLSLEHEEEIELQKQARIALEATIPEPVDLGGEFAPASQLVPDSSMWTRAMSAFIALFRPAPIPEVPLNRGVALTPRRALERMHAVYVPIDARHSNSPILHHFLQQRIDQRFLDINTEINRLGAIYPRI